MSKLHTEDSPDWHRYFAATTNNRAWELSVKERTAREDQEMLNAAHASAYHWSAVGTTAARMRQLAFCNLMFNQCQPRAAIEKYATVITHTKLLGL